MCGGSHAENPGERLPVSGWWQLSKRHRSPIGLLSPSVCGKAQPLKEPPQVCEAGLFALVLKVPLVVLHELSQAGSQGNSRLGYVVFTVLMQIQFLDQCQACGHSTKCP